jgi:hypothetical protein
MISKNLVLQGAGMDATTLYFTKSFEDLYGNTANYAAGESSDWAFGPGVSSTVTDDMFDACLLPRTCVHVCSLVSMVMCVNVL